MTRSDGSFPYFRHLSIKVDLPPDGWNDGARRCSHCDRLWPHHDAFKTSPCCNAETGRCKRVLDLSTPGAMKNAVPQMTWAEAVTTLLKWRFELLYQVWNEGLNDAELYFFASEQVDEDLVKAEIGDEDRLLGAG